MVKVQALTRPADVDVHAVALDLALRWSRSHRVQPQVSGVQVLLCPLPVIQLTTHVQNGLLLKLHTNTHCYTSIRSQGVALTDSGQCFITHPEPFSRVVFCPFAQLFIQRAVRVFQRPDGIGSGMLSLMWVVKVEDSYVQLHYVCFCELQGQKCILYIIKCTLI